MQLTSQKTPRNELVMRASALSALISSIPDEKERCNRIASILKLVRALELTEVLASACEVPKEFIEQWAEGKPPFERNPEVRDSLTRSVVVAVCDLRAFIPEDTKKPTFRAVD